jgi:hypothetical protein
MRFEHEDKADRDECSYDHNHEKKHHPSRGFRSVTDVGGDDHRSKMPPKLLRFVIVGLNRLNGQCWEAGEALDLLLVPGGVGRMIRKAAMATTMTPTMMKTRTGLGKPFFPPCGVCDGSIVGWMLDFGDAANARIF